MHIYYFFKYMIKFHLKYMSFKTGMILSFEVSTHYFYYFW